ncbi:gluconokinase [Roseobacter sp. CCS2]|uniref:gluconokinase n=1 Tax=Roseobacter sp. CCS2 TaxID=391593 RepID=UPI0000F40480|nr:gluconokinase [Roseobacter sp. CCS2]EBA14028.1 gluconokinase [Roseobacter sp. CCS2]
MAADSQHCAIVIMGVCGVGKTSVGRTLAARMSARFIEADDYHSAENRNAMAHGIPLSDEMRLPWLERLACAAEKARQDETVIMACSALKRGYRDLLRDGITNLQFVFLNGDRDIIADRIMKREDHFMPLSLLDSQIAILDLPTPDENVLAVDIAPPKHVVDDVVERAVRSKAFDHHRT